MVALLRTHLPVRPVRAVTAALLVAVVLAMTLLTVGVVTRRWQAVPVLSGSMRPAIEPGALAFSVSRPTADVQVGDVIVFQAPTSARAVTVHRVSSVRSDGDAARVTTKGDANDIPDPWGEFTIPSDRVWVVTGSLAGWGRPILWARTPTAQLLSFAALVVGGAMYLSDWRMRRRGAFAGLRSGALRARPRALARPAAEAPPASDRRQRVDPRSTERATMSQLATELTGLDLDWWWEPASRTDDGAPELGHDAAGTPTSLWLTLHACGTQRVGVATRRPDARDPRQELVIEALAFAAAGLKPPTPVGRPAPHASVPRRPGFAAAAARLRRGAGSLALVPILALGLSGPGANATLTDRAVDEITVSTRGVAPPVFTSASTALVMGACEVTLVWEPSTSAGVDGYVFDRQPIAAGTAESDAAGMTAPTPLGPFETVLRVAGGDTSTAVDVLQEESLQTASRFRYRARATIGEWEGGNSNVVDAQALGTCVS